MFTSDIAKTVVIAGPADYAGSYTSTKSPIAATWSWYLDGVGGDRKPHFTVGQYDDSNTGWFRFHVTVPIPNGTSVANGHVFYIIKNGGVTRQVKGADNRDEMQSAAKAPFVEKITGASGALLDQLAYNFWYAASH